MLLPSGATTVNSGDVHENSQYWITWRGKQWYQIDLKPKSSTLQQLVNGSTATLRRRQLPRRSASTTGPSCLATTRGGPSPTSAARPTRRLQIRFDRGNHTWPRVHDYGQLSATGNNATATWGALYATADGFLYGSENFSGEIWRVQPLNVSRPAEFVVRGPPSSANDGARCILAPSPG